MKSALLTARGVVGLCWGGGVKVYNIDNTRGVYVDVHIERAWWKVLSHHMKN